MSEKKKPPSWVTARRLTRDWKWAPGVTMYETTRGWKWVVVATNGRVVDRADEPFSSKANAWRALRAKARILYRIAGKP